MKRLQTILSLIEGGCRLADVGCDHAYITIEALRSGAASFAYASDVRPGPLERARKNVDAAGLSGRVALKLADGLDGAEEFRPDTVVIAGMGGELIARILNDAPFVRSPGVKLILQPMTSTSELRSYLLGSGFYIERERIAKEGRRVYQILTASYRGGEPQDYSPAELETGRDHEDTELVPYLLGKYIAKYKKMIGGIAVSGGDGGGYADILAELKEKYENVTAL